jgi:hypothetical protein
MKNNIPKINSVWGGADGKTFIVLGIVEQDNKTWVFYRDHQLNGNQILDPKEYSCYAESFVSRLRETLE